jgi:hypothetical protein
MATSSPTSSSYRARRLDASAKATWTRTMVGPAMQTTFSLAVPNVWRVCVVGVKSPLVQRVGYRWPEDGEGTPGR